MRPAFRADPQVGEVAGRVGPGIGAQRHRAGIYPDEPKGCRMSEIFL